MGSKTLPPRIWIRYWVATLVVVAPACVIIGLANHDYGLAFLGAMIALVGVPMIGFWRRREAERGGA